MAFYSSYRMAKVVLLLFLVNIIFVFEVNAKAPKTSFGGKIVGGVPINIIDAPYQVVVQLGGAMVCGGAIISPNFIVTAGHCILRTTSYYSIRAGTSDHLLNGTIHSAVNISVHPKYDDVLYDYDISLIEIDPPIQFDPTRQPITIASGELSAEVIITGWGMLTENGNLSRILQSVTVPVVSENDCNVLLEEYGGISSRMFCAGSEGHDSCQGDSGGPVVSNGVLLGVVSWGVGCARSGYPGVNTKLANPEIRLFIRELTGV